MIRGVRGATTVPENNQIMIEDYTEELLREMVHFNQIVPDQVASVFISVTNDINAGFPAKALRKLKRWEFVPVMCMQEIPVPNGLEKCIRIMMHIETGREQQEIEHIYLHEAVKLRPDLVKHKQEETKE
ncbi:chorismate mutase [Bacillaceae bacterium S4-13-58]